MNYFVIGPDGNRYGPADIPTLNEWIADQRLAPDTLLESAESGERLAARSVPGLNFPSASPYATPTGPQAGAEGNYAAYPRAGYGTTYQPGVGLPAELVGKFNWGSFFGNWIWGLNHKAYLTLISLGLIPFNVIVRLSHSTALSLLTSGAALGLSIWYGIKGYEWAWQSGRFQTPEECIKCQKIWAYWYLGLLIFSCLCGIGAVATMGAAGAAAMQGAR